MKGNDEIVMEDSGRVNAASIARCGLDVRQRRCCRIVRDMRLTRHSFLHRNDPSHDLLLQSRP